MSATKPDLPMPRFNDLLTIDEAAPMVRKTEGAMRWWIKQADCPIRVARIGGRLFVSRQQLEQFIADQFSAGD